MSISCKHCGNPCEEEHPISNELHFCCDGCQLVYELLDENGLCTYYDLDKNPGIRIKQIARKDKFAFLDLDEIKEQLIDFEEGNHSKIKFYIPNIHCSSCIWLLEKLYRLKDGISSSQVNFVKKECSILFDNELISLRQLVELLDAIGYSPEINLAGSDDKKKVNRSIVYKLGVAGFAFGNIMLLSFPEYLSSDFELEQEYIRFFAWINLGLSLPVLFYSSQDYFISAYKGLKHKIINIDVPISLGILSIFIRSSYEIISATLVEAGKESPISVTNLKNGDQILIRNEELIPADCSLISNSANIDYSFVTGEAVPVKKVKGEQFYAGD